MKKDGDRETMSDEQLIDRNAASETYKFLNALLDDYTACKTELARGGILKTYRMLLDRISEDHLKQIEKNAKLEKELIDIKTKVPKTKEEIANILNETGSHILEKSKEIELNEAKQIAPEKFFCIDTSSEADKEVIKTEEFETKKVRNLKKVANRKHWKKNT